MKLKPTYDFWIMRKEIKAIFSLWCLLFTFLFQTIYSQTPPVANYTGNADSYIKNLSMQARTDFYTKRMVDWM